MIIAVLNSKGGVGKTTDRRLSRRRASPRPRRRVLLVDLDSQAAASRWLGVPRNQLRPSTASVLLEKYPILKAIRHTPLPHLDLLSGSLELANADVALADVRGREAALRRDARADHAALRDGHRRRCAWALAAGRQRHRRRRRADRPGRPRADGRRGAGPAVCFDRPRSHAHAGARPACSASSSRRSIRAARCHRECSERLRAEYRDEVFHTEIRWTRRWPPAPQMRPPAGRVRRASAVSPAKCCTVSPRRDQIAIDIGDGRISNSTRLGKVELEANCRFSC